MTDEAMKEPAYILENGTPVPYLPVEVKTARDAYAASLHVLFKHVADFHLCIVRTFSTKYGIPEDEILQTIQESEEFKNMKVDPVLDTDKFNTLGYLPVASVQEPTVKPIEPQSVQSVEPVVKKTPIPSKTKKVKSAVMEPVAEPIVVVEDERHDPAPATNVVTNVVADSKPTKPKVIRKKVVQKPAVEPSTAVNLFDIDAHATNAIASNTNGTLQAQVLETKTPVPSTEEQIKPKTIRKKVVQKQVEVVALATEATNAVAPATEATNAPNAPNAVAPATNTVAPATEAPNATNTNTVDAPRKIIRK